MVEVTHLDKEGRENGQGEEMVGKDEQGQD